MWTFLSSTLALSAIGGYVYVAVMFGRASRKAGHSWKRAAFDAVTWPVMGWQAIEDLYKA